MTTRIVFNGQEYASVEDMPEEVRRAYQQVLVQFADADQNGIPDILERAAGGNVIAFDHSSITVNGRSYDGVNEMPAAVRRLYEQAMARVNENCNGLPDRLEAAVSRGMPPSPSTDRAEFPPPGGEAAFSRPHGREPMMSVLGRLDRILDTFLRTLLGVFAVAILVGAGLFMLTIAAGPHGQWARWYVAVAALLALGAVDSQFAWLMRRREPLNLTESPAYRRYRILSLLLGVACAVVLFGLALLLP